MNLKPGPVFFCFVLSIQFATAQSPELNADKWAQVLDDKGYEQYEKIRLHGADLVVGDSARVFKFLEALAQKGKSKGYHFWSRFNCLKAKAIYYKDLADKLNHGIIPPKLNLDKEQVVRLLSSAIDMAYRSEDDYLIAFVSFTYASTIVNLGETALAVMYSKNGVDLWEKLSYPVSADSYQFVAEILYRVREYDQCIIYARKAVKAWQSSPNEYKPFTVSCINTVALGYHRLKMFDSALIHYNQALLLAKQINNPVWEGIVSGNMGQLFYLQGKYDSAYSSLKKDYETSKDSAIFDNAGNSLQWAARTSLAMGNSTRALAEMREAFRLLKLWPDPNYLRNAYYTATQIFRQMGSYDSAFYYDNLYSTINDSLEKVVATSSIAITKARLNDEISRYNIQTLNKEKRAQLFLRNMLIAGIIILFLIVLLIINRKRLKEKMKMEKVEREKLIMEKEKLLMEQEISSAKEQMKMFTNNIIEKTNLIEKLESQVKNKQASSEQQTIITELSQRTILTEDDWFKFKTLFEKIHPGFFIKLKEKFPDITLAEQRMASLIRLRLTTNQMASMLGISAGSVHKSRQRLRQRFQVGADSNLDELVTNF